MANIKDRMADASVGLIVDSPFFGSLLLKYPLTPTESVPTLAVKMDGHILYNPEWCDQRSRRELVFLLAHETLHQVFAHLARRGDRDPQVWNIANDAVINDILKHEGIGDFVEGGVEIKDARLKSSEELYDELMKDAQGQGAKAAGNGGMSDDLMHDDEADGLTDQERQDAISDAKVALAQAASQAKMMGKLSAGMERICKDFIDSKVPWHQVLERFFNGRASQRISWNRPNKRYLRKAYLPRREPQPSMGPIIIGVDTSGSISMQELAQYFGHLQAIIDQCNPSKVTVLYADSEVCAVDEFTPNDYPITPRESIPGCGGTDMRAITDWVKENGEEPDVCLIFTDGYTPFPTAEEAPFPLVWVCTTDVMDKREDIPGEIIRDWRQ